MTTKLGPHIMSGGDPMKWIAVGSRIIKLDPMSLGLSTSIPVGPLVIGKLDQQDDAIGLTNWKAMMARGVSPEDAAVSRFSAQKSIPVGPNKPPVNRYLANPRIDAWEFDNEVQPDNAGEADWYGRYCIGMMSLYDQIGCKAVLFNFSTGTPSPEIWRALVFALRVAQERGHYIGIHEYLGYEATYGIGYDQIDANGNRVKIWHGRTSPNGEPDTSYPWGWAALRYRYIHDTVLAPAGLGNLKTIVTELGCDAVGAVTPRGMPTGSWRYLSEFWLRDGLNPALNYANMLAWYGRLISADPYLIGAVIFTVGSVGIWEDWDIGGTAVEDHLLSYISANPGPAPEPEPTPVPEPTPMNIYINGSFEDGWTETDPPSTTQNPNGWRSRWNTGSGYPNLIHPPSAYLVGEAVHAQRKQIPDEEEPIFFDSGDWTYKVFASFRAFWFYLKSHELTLDPGRYRLTVRVYADTYRWDKGNNRKDFDIEPNHAQIMVKAAGVEVRPWTNLKAGERNIVVTEFDHAGGLANLAVHFACHWAIDSNNLWMDGWKLERITVAPPPPPPPPPPTGKHRAIVVKMPQNASLDQWLEAARYAYGFNHTITASLDDMMTILRGGNAESYVKLAYPHLEHEDAVPLLIAAGYTYEKIFGLRDALDSLKLGFPFTYRYAMTSPFNAARTYANKLHEGVDYDIIGGAVNNTIDVLAVHEGVVDFSRDTDKGYGKEVRIRHERGGHIFYTRYAHLDKRYVTQGQQVVQGQAIGEIGTTGNVTGEHLHLNLEVPGMGLSGYAVNNVVNPSPFMPSPAEIAALPLYRGEEEIDLARFLVAHPDCWRVVKMADPSSGETHTEDVQDYEFGDGFYVRRKGGNGEWYRIVMGNHLFIHDTSPGPDSRGVGRVYTIESATASRSYGAVKYPAKLFIGQVWSALGNHFVQFRAKDDCRLLDENSGLAKHTAQLIRRERDFTFNKYGQSLTFEEVIWIKTGVETQIFGRIDGKSCGWIGWVSPWGESEPVEVHWDRGQMTAEPDRICNWEA